jgi:hypothetical protein
MVPNAGLVRGCARTLTIIRNGHHLTFMVRHGLWLTQRGESEHCTERRVQLPCQVSLVF